MEYGEEEDPVAAAAEQESMSGYGLMPPRQPSMSSIPTLTDRDVLRMMGKDSLERYAGDFDSTANAFRAQYAQSQAQAAASNASAYRAYLAASEKAQIDQAKALEKQNDPFLRAQNIYGKTGNLAAARVIAKTTGPALFTLGEQIDLGPGQRFAIRPVGDLDIPNQDGTSSKVPAWQVIRANGVNVVPYLGGDEEAKAFRNMAARMGEVMVSLQRLEEAYTTSGNVSSPYSDLKADLVQIEGTLARDVSQLRSGSKSMAGVSDKELEAIQQTLPQSATNLRDTKGEGARRARNTRQQLMGLMMRTARMNGVELVQLKDQSAPTRGVTTPRGTPPGTELKPNGKQSGSSTSGQPR